MKKVNKHINLKEFIKFFIHIKKLKNDYKFTKKKIKQRIKDL